MCWVGKCWNGGVVVFCCGGCSGNGSFDWLCCLVGLCVVLFDWC